MTGKINPAHSGVYRSPAKIDDLRERAKAAGLTWFELNLAAVGSKREFLTACAKSLRFPRSFGGNWDALADCLKDLCADSIIQCRNGANFAEMAPDDYATALEILQDAATYWEERGSTFIALADAAPEGAELPLFPAR